VVDGRRRLFSRVLRSASRSVRLARHVSPLLDVKLAFDVDGKIKQVVEICFGFHTDGIRSGRFRRRLLLHDRLSKRSAGLSSHSFHFFQRHVFRLRRSPLADGSLLLV